MRVLGAEGARPRINTVSQILEITDTTISFLVGTIACQADQLLKGGKYQRKIVCALCEGKINFKFLMDLEQEINLECSRAGVESPSISRILEVSK